jgi:hypothetical protein
MSIYVRLIRIDVWKMGTSRHLSVLVDVLKIGFGDRNYDDLKKGSNHSKSPTSTYRPLELTKCMNLWGKRSKIEQGRFGGNRKLNIYGNLRVTMFGIFGGK